MKLELKHLAPYLPYGLEVQFIGDLDDNDTRIDSHYINIGEVAKLGAVEFRYTNTIYWMDFKRGYFGVNSDNIKPILRPLSDLFNGNYEDILDEFSERSLESFKISFLSELKPLSALDKINYTIAVKLFENHFDVFGLIEQGLAIDKNTIL